MIKIPLALVVGGIITLLTIADITIHTIYKFTITNKNFNNHTKYNTNKCACMHVCNMAFLFMHHTQNGSVIFPYITKLIQIFYNQLSNNFTQEFSKSIFLMFLITFQIRNTCYSDLNILINLTRGYSTEGLYF